MGILTGLLVCTVLLEFPFRKFMRIWLTCICWLHCICLPLFCLHQLNGLLLVFILLWAVSTYIFNVAFAFLNWKLGKVVLSLGWNFCVYYSMIGSMVLIYFLNSYIGHGNLGDGWVVALSNTWILSACTVLSWNFSCSW